MKIIRFILAVILFSLASFAIAQEDTKRAEMGVQFLEIDNQAYLAITLENQEGWHTYWKNPGDAGIPIKFEFKSGETPYRLRALEWPAPKRFIEPGDILAYGYSGTYTFFYQITENNLNDLDGK